MRGSFGTYFRMKFVDLMISFAFYVEYLKSTVSFLLPGHGNTQNIV